MSGLVDFVEKGKDLAGDALTFLTGTSDEIREKQVNEAVYFGILGLETVAAAIFSLKFVVPVIYNMPYLREFDPVLALPALDGAVRYGNALVDAANLSIRPETYHRFDFIGVIGTAKEIKRKYFSRE